MRPWFVIGLAACASSPSTTPTTTPTTPTPTTPTPTAAIAPPSAAARYAAAVQDAREATRAEIVRDLRAITPTAPGLTWRDGKVLVVTWTGWPGYDGAVGSAMPSGREVWVTAVPDVQTFCKTVDPDGLVARLEQRLGLRPNNGKTRFVELWVAPGDLFRPCPDAEITDAQCELDFDALPVPATDAHRRWFEKLQAGSYGEPGYPWTRLGYTYDWGGAREVGPSEFVVRAGATVDVAKVMLTSAYCGR
ncbi:MAG: hypothetical protein NT062_28545 [Proteobacteria bacterium]|nr:hypothetical protein [Pseudomonadota bacterium]